MHMDTYSGIFIDCHEKAGNDADGKKQSEPALPGHHPPLRHILEKNNQYQRGPGYIGSGLKDLPDGCMQGGWKISRQSQVKDTIDDGAEIKGYFFFGTLHMNTLETLYFPDTVITTDGRLLFLFFDRVHILQPVEDHEADRQAQDLSDSFMDQRFCQVHTPAPLGADRSRFLHLVRDIEKRTDDYAAQLSSLAIASLSAPADDKEESRYSLISSLFDTLPDDSAAGKKETERQAGLWQARLVLAIAEILDHADEEVADALTSLNRSQADLFDRLLGKDDEFDEQNPFTDLSQVPEKVISPRAGLNRHRFKAWLTLFGAAELPAWWLWTTSRPEVADSILEMYETRCGKAAIPLLRLELPAAAGIKLQDHGDAVEVFREEAAALLAEISEGLGRLVGSDGVPVPAFLSASTTWASRWRTLLETRFPAQRFGRTPFCLHLLSDLGFAQLAGLPSQANQPADGTAHAILAVIG